MFLTYTRMDILMHQILASVTTKGQVTIPAEVRRLIGVRPHEKIAFLIEDNQVRLTSARSVVAQTAGLLKGPLLILTNQEEETAAEEAMAVEMDQRS
jgi:AbrB family looped-hinge helix DNA binding protein